MDGGPFRGSRPSARSATNRPEAVHRPSDELPVAHEEVRSTAHRAQPHYAMKEEKSLKRIILPLIVGLLTIILLGVGGWMFWSNTQNNPATTIDSGKYQAVFFTNGQVYFGKLQVFNDKYLKLTDIFYLQTQSSSTNKDAKNPQETTNDQNGVQLIKLGDEIHGPEDEMMISRDQLLFYENLKTDGKVAQSIEKYKKPN